MIAHVPAKWIPVRRQGHAPVCHGACGSAKPAENLPGETPALRARAARVILSPDPQKPSWYADEQDAR
jgi:hypothetical protein